MVSIQPSKMQTTEKLPLWPEKAYAACAVSERCLRPAQHKEREIELRAVIDDALASGVF